MKLFIKVLLLLTTVSSIGSGLLNSSLNDNSGWRLPYFGDSTNQGVKGGCLVKLSDFVSPNVKILYGYTNIGTDNNVRNTGVTLMSPKLLHTNDKDKSIWMWDDFLYTRPLAMVVRGTGVNKYHTLYVVFVPYPRFRNAQQVPGLYLKKVEIWYGISRSTYVPTPNDKIWHKDSGELHPFTYQYFSHEMNVSLNRLTQNALSFDNLDLCLSHLECKKDIDLSFGY